MDADRSAERGTYSRFAVWRARIGHVTDLVLTAERRAELAALLNDESRMNAEYPKLADYLDTALRLEGTGDDHADRAFDLRLVHYAVGGNVDTPNPYWDTVAPSISRRDGRRVVDGGKRDGSARLAYAELFLQGLYAYAIPSPETIEWVAEFCDGASVVELGAGRGYWAAQLARCGLAIEAYDVAPPDEAGNDAFPSAVGQQDVWHPVHGVADLSRCVADRADHVLFLCWPPGWGSTMASEALAAFESTGGSRLLFIGEPRGGMTGDPAFFDALSNRWRLATHHADFVSWWNVSDVAQGWVRR